MTPEREKLLVVGKKQNIYGTADVWIEEKMRSAGFSGRWMKLKTSHRLPLGLISILRDYAEPFLYKEEVDLLTEPTQGNIDLGPVELRWIHLFPNRSGVDVCFEELRRQIQYLRIDTVDITVLVPQNDIELAFVQMCEKKGIPAVYTIDQDDCRKIVVFSRRRESEGNNFAKVSRDGKRDIWFYLLRTLCGPQIVLYFILRLVF